MLLPSCSKKELNQHQKIEEQNKEMLMAHWTATWPGEWWWRKHGHTLRDNKLRESFLGFVPAVLKKCKDSKMGIRATCSCF